MFQRQLAGRSDLDAAREENLTFGWVSPCIAHPVFLDTRLAGINVTGSGERGCEAGGDDDAGGASGGAPGKSGVRGGDEEALAARGRVSPSTGRSYPLTLVCEAWRVPRSSAYALRSAVGGECKPGKRGPKTELSDEALVVEIRTVLSESPFVGKGHRKVRARLAAKGTRAGKNRVLRLMRENGLLAPVRRGRPRADRSHGGRIRTERPDELWGHRRGAVLDAEGGLVLVLRRGGPLRDRRGGLARGEEGGPLGGAGAGAAGCSRPHGGLREGGRCGPRPPVRLGLAVPGEGVPGRDQVARDPLHAGVRGRARVQGLYIILHLVGRWRQELGGWVVEWSTCAPAAWRAGVRLAVHTSTGSCRCRGGRGAARDYAIF